MGRIRTYTPWGHVSAFDRAARQAELSHMAAYVRLAGEPEFPELRAIVVKIRRGLATEDEVRQMNELANALNARGYSDHDIERAL